MENPKVFLVDDEEEFTSTLAERLRLRGFDVDIANDGVTALQHIIDNPPHVVLLDVKMPVIGGLEVLARIKSVHSHIPVILLTGVGSTRDGIEGMHAGAFDFLMKPLQIEMLIDKISEALKGID
jgi:DNA-binding response OmpR family regulator